MSGANPPSPPTRNAFVAWAGITLPVLRLKNGALVAVQDALLVATSTHSGAVCFGYFSSSSIVLYRCFICLSFIYAL